MQEVYHASEEGKSASLHECRTSASFLLCQSCLPKGHQRRRVCKARRKVSNVSLHGGVPEALEVKGAPFLKSPLGRPPIEGDAVGGGEYAAAIATQPAVHKYLFFRPLPNKGEKLSDLFILRRRPAGAPYID